jgi:hypothetical protein
MLQGPKPDANNAIPTPVFLRGWQRGVALWALVAVVNLVGDGLMYAFLVKGQSANLCTVASTFPLTANLAGVNSLPGWWDTIRIVVPCPMTSVDNPAFSVYDFALGTTLAAIATAVCAGPLIWFLMHTWFARYDEFRNSLKDGALRAYLERFWARRLISELARLNLIPQKFEEEDESAWREAAAANPPVCQNVFKAIYHSQYGLGAFLTPFILLVTISFVAAFLVARMRGCMTTGTACSPFLFANEAPVVISAIAGAFMFAVGDSVRCIRQRSLTVSDAFWYALRLFLAVPVGLAFAGYADPKAVQTAVAFGLAMFPLNDFLKLIRRFAFPQVLAKDDDENGDKLLQLAGVTIPIAAIFAAEGIYSVEQMATFDPVLLSIRTGLPFRFILSLGSQAVVRRHLGAQSGKLADIGLGDALPILDVVRALDAPPGTPGLKVRSPEIIVQSAMKQLGGSDSGPLNAAVVEMKFREIAAEEYTIFLDHVVPFDTPTVQSVALPRPVLEAAHSPG